MTGSGVTHFFIAVVADYAFGSNPPYVLRCGHWLFSRISRASQCARAPMIRALAMPMVLQPGIKKISALVPFEQ
jgi:hypothetical protein